MRLSIALRNLLRHKLRSLLSLSMIAGGVAAIIIFRGYSHNTVEFIKELAADNQYGHLQIARKSQFEPHGESRSEKMLQNTNELKAAIEKVPGVIKTSGRISSYGLVSNGDNTVSTMLVGYDPTVEIMSDRIFHIDEGETLQSATGNEILVGIGLRKQLNVNPGDTLSVLAHTVDGVINAYDLTVKGIFQTGTTDVDNQVLFLPLKTMQTLLDTDTLDIITIRTTDLNTVDALKAPILAEVRKIDNSVVVKTWRDLADLFRRIEEFFSIQNALVQTILISLMLLGIMNTVSMTVFERTGEIGTVRSLGESRSTILKQFLFEGALLGVIGVVAGYISAIIMIIIINAINIPIALPGASTDVIVEIDFVPSAFVLAAILGLGTTIIATYLPSARAAKMQIVEALRKNI